MIRISVFLVFVGLATQVIGMDFSGHPRPSNEESCHLPLKKRVLRDLREDANASAIYNSQTANSSDDRGAINKDLSPLHYAVEINNISDAQALLKNGADINARLEDGTTPMHLAIIKNNPEMLALLMSYNPNLYAKDNDNTTLLHAAAIVGNHTLATQLCYAGVEVNAANNDQTTALHFAAHNGHARTVEILIRECHAEINALDDHQRTPLYVATLQNHPAIVELLLTARANVNAADTEHLTPLHIASWNGHQSIVETLIDARATIDALSIQRNTPLHLAAMNGHVAIATMLIEHGANITIANDDKTTPEALFRIVCPQEQADLLHFKAKQYREIQQTIIDIRAGKIDATAIKNGATMLHRATSSNALALVAFLLENHLIAVNFKELVSPYRTALHYAAAKNNHAMVRLLLAHGADPLAESGANGSQRPSALAPVGSPAYAALIDAEIRALTSIDLNAPDLESDDTTSEIDLNASSSSDEE